MKDFSAEEYMQRMKIQSEYESMKNYREWVGKVPYLSFKPEWEVSIMPPFAGALVRFRVRYNERQVSVYLDVDDSLGYVEAPYWEIYPDAAGDNARFLLNETDDLIKAIEESLLSDYVH